MKASFDHEKLGVCMEMGFSLGANLGDRLANLIEARQRLEATEGITVLTSAPVYETEPVDVSAAHRNKAFLNTVVIASCGLSLEAVADCIHAIETAMGRVREEDRNAPRPIDVDVIYVIGEHETTPRLELPHPRWTQRRFVVEPLAAVRPHLVLGPDRRTVLDILLSLSDTPRVVLLRNEW